MKEREKQVFDTLNEYARMAANVPVDVAAAICGVNPQTLRQGIERGTVPFAFETTRAGSSRKSFVISPAALWRWWSGGKEAME